MINYSRWFGWKPDRLHGSSSRQRERRSLPWNSDAENVTFQRTDHRNQRTRSQIHSRRRKQTELTECSEIRRLHDSVTVYSFFHSLDHSHLLTFLKIPSRMCSKPHVTYLQRSLSDENLLLQGSTPLNVPLDDKGKHDVHMMYCHKHRTHLEPCEPCRNCWVLYLFLCWKFCSDSYNRVYFPRRRRTLVQRTLNLPVNLSVLRTKS